ncbi:MAG: O-antigen ligase family protein [Gaiella sp.]
MDGGTRPAAVSRFSLVLVGALGLLCTGFVFAGGGSGEGAIASVGGAAVALAVVALVLALRGIGTVPRLDAAGWAVVLGSVGLACWSGASIAWSVAGDASWSWLNRGVVYLAALVLGGLVGVRVRWLAVVLGVVLGAALLWALAGVGLPELHPDGDRRARLRDPVGYWNALALLANAAIVLGLWVAAAESRVRRAAGGALVFAALVALLLTQSRAGIVAAVVVVAFWLALGPRGLESALLLALVALPAAVVAGWAFSEPALVDDDVGRRAREDVAPLFAALALAGLAVTCVLAAGAPLRQLAESRRRSVIGALVGGTCLLVVAGIVGLAIASGNPITWAGDQISGGECSNDPGRLVEACANNRLAWWDEALEVAEDHLLGGTGAGTFSVARLPVRDDASSVREPHSVPLQLLSDGGLVAVALALLVAGGALAGFRRALRRTEGVERTAVVALAALPLAFAVHALVDYDLDFLAVSGPALVALGAVLAAGRPTVLMRGGLPAVVSVVAVGAALLASLASPRLAAEAVDDAYVELDVNGRTDRAASLVSRARTLDPLSLGPLYVRALIADREGRERAAVQWYEAAVRMQPENPEPLVELGRYHTFATGDLCAAYKALNAAYTLDPKSRRWSKGGPLDLARDAVDNGACE